MAPYTEQQKVFLFVYPLLHVFFYYAFVVMAFSGGVFTTDNGLVPKVGEYGTNAVAAPLLLYPNFYNLPNLVQVLILLFIGLLYGLVLSLAYKLIFKK